ncbi:AAEL017111-PA [Aedes aegypti]|uniref:AAEL017111-PA n=2 Tax=Aedes aegypti TaxID=7159 RepID=A0A1S4G5D9_AEDAE|nr:uncharacterized protein LOC23687531 [Aedes aegypti]EJY57476.1 AAEL017111-PA [Aedes aegypti]
MVRPVLIGTLVVLFCSVSGVWCLFGSRIVAPNITDAIIASAKYSSGWTYDPHNSITKRETAVDSSGTLGTLFAMTKSISDPMMLMIDTIYRGASDKRMKMDRWFGFIYNFIKQSIDGVEEANSTMENLKNNTKPYLYNNLKRDLTSLNKIAMIDLIKGLRMFYIEIKEMNSTEYHPHSNNITINITERVVCGVTSPLKSANTYMSSITSTISAIASDRRQIISYHAKLNETMNVAIRQIAKAFISLNRTVVQAQHEVQENITLTFDVFNQSHGFILEQANYFGNDNSSLLSVPSTMAIERENLSKFIDNSTKFCMDQVTKSLHGQTLLVTNQLISAMNNVTNQFAVSSHFDIGSCTQDAVQQLIDSAKHVNRMGSCVDSELESFRKTSTVVHKQLWNTIGSIAFATMDLLPVSCAKKTGQCIDINYFSNNITHHARSRMTSGVEQFIDDERAISDRIVDCVKRIGRTTELYAREINNKFQGCLGEQVK